jgi:hypothetical protein
LNNLGLKSKSGRVRWTANGVVALLSNEKNAGDLRARKTITRSYKTQKSKKNEGEKPQYYARGHHEGIVPPLAYDVALRIIKNRRGNVLRRFVETHGRASPRCIATMPEGIQYG